MFANLPFTEQANRVLDALQALLGDLPTRADYVALLHAIAAVAKTLEHAIRHMPTDEQLQ